MMKKPISINLLNNPAEMPKTMQYPESNGISLMIIGENSISLVKLEAQLPGYDQFVGVYEAEHLLQQAREKKIKDDLDKQKKNK